MTKDFSKATPRPDLSDWSSLPADIFVTNAKGDGIAFDVSCCSVPMALVPEVRYVRADIAAARIAELEAALKPFARVADWDIADNEPNTAKYYPMDGRYAVGGVLKIGDFRRALAALEKDKAND